MNDVYVSRKWGETVFRPVRGKAAPLAPLQW